MYVTAIIGFLQFRASRRIVPRIRSREREREIESEGAISGRLFVTPFLVSDPMSHANSPTVEGVLYKLVSEVKIRHFREQAEHVGLSFKKHNIKIQCVSSLPEAWTR